MTTGLACILEGRRTGGDAMRDAELGVNRIREPAGCAGQDGKHSSLLEVRDGTATVRPGQRRIRRGRSAATRARRVHLDERACVSLVRLALDIATYAALGYFP